MIKIESYSLSEIITNKKALNSIVTILNDLDKNQSELDKTHHGLIRSLQSKKDILKWIKDNKDDHGIFISTLNNEIIGLIITTSNSNYLNDSITISDFYVDPQHRGKGYGETLLKYVINHYKTQNENTKILLGFINGNNAEHLYKKLNFKPHFTHMVL